VDENQTAEGEAAALSAELRAYLSWARDAGMVGLSTAPPKPPTTTTAIATMPMAEATAPKKLTVLADVRSELGECTRCKLHKCRTNIVFGVGNERAKLVFVGEAPGEDEDLKGEPFVGKAGQLLTKMIEAMGLQRSDVYICNTVKCRPPNNRNPEPDELSACEPFLQGQLASLRPEVIVTLGKFAAQALLRDQSPISRLRGAWRQYEGIPLMPTFHPAYLLRSPGEKGKVWGDLQLVMKKLGLPPRGGSA
jgi:DNA polymerase